MPEEVFGIHATGGGGGNNWGVSARIPWTGSQEEFEEDFAWYSFIPEDEATNEKDYLFKKQLRNAAEQIEKLK